MTSERDCINRIFQQVKGQVRDYLIKGIGDDCAVIEKDNENHLLLTTDTLVEGVHFDLAWHPPHLLGRKCASVNLSDIAAMGGIPRTCLLSVGFPGSVAPWFDDFIAGFVAVLKEYDTLLVGGDTVRSREDLVISVTVTGEGNRKEICYRSGARPGDLIWVSGPLGSSGAGLELCRRGLFRSGMENNRWQPLAQAHLDPEPQIALGRILATSSLAHSMLDISDGLATDLAHLCRESGVGAEIDRDCIPLDALLKEAAAELGLDPYDWAVKGGEDYQLLFTAGPESESELRSLVKKNLGREIFRIGGITAEAGVMLNSGGSVRRDISFQGYDHFGAGS